jgi:xylulokinase
MSDSLAVVDVGTSSVRASVLSDAGELTRVASRRVSTLRGRDGSAVLDSRALWDAVGETVREATADERVGGLCVAAQLGVVLLDGQCEPVVPPMTWADQRGRELLDGLDPDVEELVRSRSGRRPSPELAAVKLAWLHHTDPTTARRVRWAVSLKDHLVQRLTGEIVTDATHASYTLLYDVARHAWSAELADAFDVDPGVLPPVHPASGRLELCAPAAAALGMRAGVPVAVGGPDGTIGALGAGAVSDGDTVDIAGSTDVLVHVTGQALLDDRAAAVLNAHAAPGLWTLGGPTGLTGGGLRHLLAAIGKPDVAAAHDELSAAAADLPAGADGLTVLTTLGGGRFPHWRPALAGGVIGLREEHSPAHLLRAAHEGAAFLVLDGIEAIERLGRRIEDVVVVGGAAGGSAWLQLRADAWQRPVVRLGQAEATSIGAGMLAGVASGWFPDLPAAGRRLVRRHERIEPRRQAATGMASARHRWQRLLSLVDETTSLSVPDHQHSRST